MTTYYGVWCVVQGGVTGYRAAWLKDGDGNRAMWSDRSTAESEAKKLSDDRNGNPFRSALFSYTAREIED